MDVKMTQISWIYIKMAELSMCISAVMTMVYVCVMDIILAVFSFMDTIICSLNIANLTMLSFYLKNIEMLSG